MSIVDQFGVISAAENPLLEASPGLMIWTIVMFFVTLWILKRYVFGPLSTTIEKRRSQIEQSIQEAESSRDEAVRLLDEYKAQLATARKEADELRERGRRDGERERASIVTAAEGQRDRILSDTQQQVEAQSRQALASVRDDVAGLALAAAEKVTRKSLTDEDHRRLVEEALQELDVDKGAAPA
jgi:F-type H+-transporting ATPase subunit b